MTPTQDQPESAITLATPGSPDSPAIPGVWIAEGDLQYSFTRSGGPGGQNVNKVNTKAQLRVNIGDIHGLNDAALARFRRLAGHRLTKDDEILFDSDAHRTQLANRRSCLEKLRDLTACALHPPKPRKPTRPTRASKKRRLDSKKRQAKTKQRRQPPSPED